MHSVTGSGVLSYLSVLNRHFLSLLLIRSLVFLCNEDHEACKMYGITPDIVTMRIGEYQYVIEGTF